MLRWENLVFIEQIRNLLEGEKFNQEGFRVLLKEFFIFSGAMDMVYIVPTDDEEELYLVEWASNDDIDNWLKDVRLSDGELLCNEFNWNELHSNQKSKVRSLENSKVFTREDVAAQIEKILIIPLQSEEKIFGCILIFFSTGYYNSEEIAVLNSMGKLYSQSLQMIDSISYWKNQHNYVSSANKIYTTLYSFPDEHEVIQTVINELKERTAATGLIFVLFEPESEHFVTQSINTWGDYPREIVQTDYIDLFLTSKNQEENTEAVYRVIDPWTGNFEILTSILKVPQRTIGAIFLLKSLNNSGIKKQVFQKEEIKFLKELSSHTAIALDHCRLYSQSQMLVDLNEERVQKFSLIYQLSNLFSEAMSLDNRLNLILTAITLGDVMGFNRAMLLMIDEKTQTLKGKIGIGPSSASEAGEIWKNLRHSEGSYNEWIRQLVSSENFKSSEFHHQVKTIRIPIIPESGVLAMTVLEKKSFHVLPEDNHTKCSDSIQQLLKAGEFATTPLLSGKHVLGVIAVDNIYNHRPITKEDVQMLHLFATHAGVSIEMSMLHDNLKELTNLLEKQHQQLVQKEKLVALGELAAQVAHEIKNPLVAIGGFARILERRINDTAREKEMNYLKMIIKEVDRLERLLQHTLLLSKERLVSREKVDLNKLIEDILILYESEFQTRKILLELNLDKELPSIIGDNLELKQVFINLITNSVQAMENGGSLIIRSLMDKERGEIILEVTDTGGGIPQNLLSNIFNPFFTTKEDGVGIGLSLAHKIIEHHQGSINVINQEGESATFLVTFPMII